MLVTRDIKKKLNLKTGKNRGNGKKGKKIGIREKKEEGPYDRKKKLVIISCNFKGGR